MFFVHNDLYEQTYTSGNMSTTLETLSRAQYERLAYLDFKLLFLGVIYRQDLMDRFGISSAAATRDFALYRELFPLNIGFDKSNKSYTLGNQYTSYFKHNTERVLMLLSQGFGDGMYQSQEQLLSCELPMALNKPSISTLAPATRAIYQGKAISISYFSHSSGLSEREIVPFALANDGLRWHIRAFDRNSQEFRDFVFTRMQSITLLDNSRPAKHELSDQDIQWNRIVEIDIIPHPNSRNPEIIERDYSMKNGVLHLKVRGALAGYFLRQWQVDCSADHSSVDSGCRLWLRDVLVLHGVKSAVLALGYKPIGDSS